ncbi:hypothetical protein [Fodinicola feengrottensis]|uniref:hypothetical protein n=1 Tax=Fodinicola feengrottensis TaxID=435914 RepID=UPI0013D1DC11|nr:hypothetical protein [Fodinicola feengrottensis]
MTNTRKYGAGVITGLVSMSQGLCYWPTCDQPIVRFVDGQPVNNFETAHIRAANKGGRRYVERMNDAERNGFTNLLLLCIVHHKKLSTRSDPTTSLLRPSKAGKQPEKKPVKPRCVDSSGLPKTVYKK